jgi:6-phosphofructokinase 1
VRKGVFDAVPLDVVSGPKKFVDVERSYEPDRLRPKYARFQGRPLLMMSGEA